MRGLRWILLELAIAVGALALGWLLPDGLNLFARLLGQPTIAVAPTERLLSAMVVFIFTTTLQLMAFVRAELRQTRADVTLAVGQALSQEVGGAFDRSLVRHVLGVAADSPSFLSRLEALMRSVMAMLSPARGYVREAYLVFVERALATVSRDLLRLSGAGLEVDIADHIEITRRLAAGSGNFTQIQRRAFLVPDEWTQDWMRLVSTLPSTGTRCAYVVLMDRAEAASQMDKLDSMDRFLTKAGWSFEYCDLRDVLDSLGGVLPTEWNLDVFEGKVAKLQESPAGRYQGGVRLRMTMFDLQQEPDLRRFVDSVGTFARPHSTAGTARRPNPGSTRQRRR